MSVNTQILSASCNKCGAGLELPPGLRFATCQFCGSRLEVRFSGGAVFTEVLDASNDGDRQIAHELQLIKLQNELNRLDQEWSLEQESFRSTRRYRNLTLPTRENTLGGTIGAIVVAILGTVAWVIAVTYRAPLFLEAFSIASAAAGVLVFFINRERYAKYSAALSAYEARRARVLSVLQPLESHRGGVTPAAPESESP